MNQNDLERLQIHLALTVAEINAILMVIGKQPFEQVADLILKVRSQTLEQINMLQQPQPEAAPAAPAEPLQ